MKDGGHFGHWFDDEFGLPAYEYTCDHELDPKAASFTTRGPSRDHWHQLGNDHLNLLAHNDGSVEVMDSSRGLQWVCRRYPRGHQPGGGIAIVQDEGSNQTTWYDLFSRRNLRNMYRRVFGCGYFRKITRRNDLTLDHAVFPPFSDDPVVASEMRITNDSKEPRNLVLYDYWSVNIQSISRALAYFDEKRKVFSKSVFLNTLGKLLKLMSYALHVAPEQTRNAFASKFSYNSRYSAPLQAIIIRPVFKGRHKPSESQPAPRNYYPKAVFLSALVAKPTRAVLSTEELSGAGATLEPIDGQPLRELTPKNSPCLCLGVNITLEPKETRRLTFLFGYAEEDAVPSLINKYRSNSSTGEGLPNLRENSLRWAENLVEFDCNNKEYGWIRREAKWNSYYLRSATLFDDYFESHLLPQGGAYNYLQGLQGVTRDFMLYMIPMIYINPSLAREMLEYTMRLMTTDGRLPYCTYGFGMQGGALVHRNPSDLPLSLLWGLSEYLFATRDFRFLIKKIPFYPKHIGKSSTVVERVKLAINFVIDEVGLGEHDLIRVGDGDWNDGISTMVKNRRKFVKSGESMYNSAMALYVLPRISRLLTDRGEKNLAAKIETMWKKLLDGTMRSWNGRWFYRGWNGSGRPIGDQSMFLEPLTWLLISGDLPEDYANKLVNSIHANLDKPSKFGEFLVYPPVPTLLNYLEKGWDVNGGTWFAVDSLLAWGYSKYDAEKGWSALIKNSMKTHSQMFPEVWYGIWSGPDAFNASYASRPGETYFHIFTPTTDFPVMNLNLHANFLLALLKIAGLEPAIDGLTISPNAPLRQYELRTPILKLKISPSEIQGSYSRLASGRFKLRLRLPKQWMEEDVECYLDNERVDHILPEEPSLAVIQIPSGSKYFSFRFVCRTK